MGTVNKAGQCSPAPFLSVFIMYLNKNWPFTVDLRLAGVSGLSKKSDIVSVTRVRNVRCCTFRWCFFPVLPNEWRHWHNVSLLQQCPEPQWAMMPCVAPLPRLQPRWCSGWALPTQRSSLQPVHGSSRLWGSCSSTNRRRSRPRKMLREPLHCWTNTWTPAPSWWESESALLTSPWRAPCSGCTSRYVELHQPFQDILIFWVVPVHSSVKTKMKKKISFSQFFIGQ